MISQKTLKISARKSKQILSRICQGDIFKDIEILENISITGSKILVNKIVFPYIICLNQECDLENDYNENNLPATETNHKDSCLLHLAIAPLFLFDQFLTGKHWGDILKSNYTAKRQDTKVKLIIDNEIPRYHYLKFPDKDVMPELIIDFKHFFTMNRNLLYKNIDKRICTMEDLFKERISQRFSNFISRIGLPEETKD